MSADGWFPVTGIVMALAGAVLGWFVPALIGRIPEPEPEDEQPTEAGAVGDGRPESLHEAEQSQSPEPREGEAADEPDKAEEPEEPKELYADIASRPGLAWKSALASAVAAGLIGLTIGWDPLLLAWVYLVPVGVALAVVDWRTRLLPTKVIAPSYLVVGALTLLAGVVTGLTDSDWGPLIGAALGCVVAFAMFFVLWFVYPAGLGFGDVRLAGLLGIVLGYLGWSQLLVGLYSGFLLGGVVGLLLSLLRIVDRKGYPFGPFMLIGAVLGVYLGPGVGAWYTQS